MADSGLADYSSLNVYQKLARITGEVGIIKKGGTNRDQGYAFIEYAAVAGELRSLFAKYGVLIVPQMKQAYKQTREVVTTQRGGTGYHVLIDFAFVVVNADKPEDRFTVTWTGEATAYDDKGTNKAATSALKYYLMRQFNISEKGEDPDDETPEVGRADPVVDRTEGDQSPELPRPSTGRPASEKQKSMIAAIAHKVGKDQAWIDNIMSRPLTSAVASQTIEKLQALEQGDQPTERTWK